MIRENYRVMRDRLMEIVYWTPPEREQDENYTEYLKRGPALGYPVGEASWILEDNKPMNKALQLMCGERTKVYRIYDKTLG